MCFGSAPRIDPPKPPPPPPPAPPPPEAITPVQTAADGPSSDRKQRGRSSLRIDRTATAVGGSSGLNIPM